MRTQLWTCDHCGAQESHPSELSPHGWASVQVAFWSGGEHQTRFSRYRELCADCLEKALPKLEVTGELGDE